MLKQLIHVVSPLIWSRWRWRLLLYLTLASIFLVINEIVSGILRVLNEMNRRVLIVFVVTAVVFHEQGWLKLKTWLSGIWFWVGRGWGFQIISRVSLLGSIIKYFDFRLFTAFIILIRRSHLLQLAHTIANDVAVLVGAWLVTVVRAIVIL